MDTDPEACSKAKELFPDIVLLDSFEKQDDRYLQSILHGAIIATPPATHFKLGLEMVHRGLPVLIEKPTVTTPAEACALFAVGRLLNGGRIFDGCLLRHTSAGQQLVDALQNFNRNAKGAVAHLDFMNFSTAPAPPKGMGGPWWDLGVHMADLIYRAGFRCPSSWKMDYSLHDKVTSYLLHFDDLPVKQVGFHFYYGSVEKKREALFRHIGVPGKDKRSWTRRFDFLEPAAEPPLTTELRAFMVLKAGSEFDPGLIEFMHRVEPFRY